ncbi:MAG TPA: hypothetical protein VGH90_07605 [Chthoniobacteraceae bacterium]
MLAEMPETAHPGDSQKVGLLGRNRLVDELLRANLEVAFPIRDRGIDLIAYADLSTSVTRYVARPIQMKAAWAESFVIDDSSGRERRGSEGPPGPNFREEPAIGLEPMTC